MHASTYVLMHESKVLLTKTTHRAKLLAYHRELQEDKK